jgi:hypothetical protein
MFVFLAILIGIVGTLVALAKPQLRLVFGIVAIFGFVAAISGIGLFVFIVGQMT